MSDVYNFITSDDPRTGALTASQLEARRKIAIALATRNRPYPKTIGEGLTALGEGLGEGLYNRDTLRAEAVSQKYNEGISKDLGGGGATSPRPVPGGASLDSGDPATQAYAMAPPDATTQQSSVVAQAPQQPQMPVEEWKQRTARSFPAINEKDPYRYIGPANDQGDHGYGKYRVMGASIAPWTEQYLGVKLTPRQFLGSEKAQEALASARGSDLMSKYGPDGAAAAWFVGENNMNGDPERPNLKLHIDEHVKRFNIPLGSRDDIAASAAGGERPIQLASLGGVPTPDTAPDPREAVAQTLAGPPPQQVAQVQPPPVTPQALPPVQQRPIQGPVQEVRPVPAGPQPQPGDYIRSNPELAKQMQRLKQIRADERAFPEHRTDAHEQYLKLEQRANEADKNAFTIWHERNKANEAFDVAAEERKRAREAHEKAQQGLITGPEQRQPVDQRVLGTPQSPQRSGIPDMPPKPSHLSQTDWATQQAPELKKAIAAVNDAEPDFKSMLKVIDQIRNHPGMEWGTGLFAGYAPRGTDAYTFSGGPEEGLIGQLKGKTFLTAYDKLRGGGSIATVEGSKATQAQAAVNPAAGKDAVHTALNNLEDQIRSDFETVQRRTNRPVTAWQKNNEDEVAPDKGQIVSGFSDGKTREYIGGNPRDLTGSWKIIR